MYNMNGLDILNEHIEQGIDFTHIKNNNKNDFSLLGESFFPNLENKYTIIEGFPTPIDTEFNRLLNEYIILNNRYNTELTSTTKTVTPAQLNEKYIALKNEANSLKTKMNTLGGQNTNIITNITSNIAELNEKLNQINQLQNPLDQTTQMNIEETQPNDTLYGKLETTSLSMTSTYYHYIVYFLVCVTIIAMTFNLLFNPNADVMKSVFVVGGILAIYFISKYIVN